MGGFKSLFEQLRGGSAGTAGNNSGLSSAANGSRRHSASTPIHFPSETTVHFGSEASSINRSMRRLSSGGKVKQPGNASRFSSEGNSEGDGADEPSTPKATRKSKAGRSLPRVDEPDSPRSEGLRRGKDALNKRGSVASRLQRLETINLEKRNREGE